VMTPANRPPLAEDPDAKTNPFMFRLDVLQNDRVRYANQPIAVVIAETLEAATEGAALLSPRYEALPARVGLDASDGFVPPAVGSKGLLKGPQVLGILAARLVGRPVKLVLRREQMYGPVGHRSPSRQRLRIGTDADGVLTAIDHHAKIATSTFDDFFEPAADASHSLYASPAIATSHEAIRTDTGTPLFMRAPGEATGSIALESAIDEEAWACGMEPLAFRLKHYAEVETVLGKTFSSNTCSDATRKA